MSKKRKKILILGASGLLGSYLFNILTADKIMTKKPIGIIKDSLAVKALSLMNSKKITSLCVYDKKNKNKTIGIVHVHNILSANIS